MTKESWQIHSQIIFRKLNLVYVNKPLKLLLAINVFIFRTDSNLCYYIGLKRLYPRPHFRWLDGRNFEGFQGLIQQFQPDITGIGWDCVCVAKKANEDEIEAHVVNCFDEGGVMCQKRGNCNQ